MSISENKQKPAAAEGRGEMKKLVFFLFSLGAMFLIMAINLPEHVTHAGDAVLTKQGQAAMGVLAFALILWMTEAIPFHIAGLMGIVLLALLKIDTYKNIVMQGFGNHTITFFIGVLVLSAFITSSGLGKRIGVMILSRTGNNTKSIIFGFLVTGTVLSMWVTNMAVAAMLMPLAVAILEEEGVKPLKSNFGRALLIACAWGSIIGGIATPSGAGPNPLAIGFLKSMADIDISFVQWMMYGVPAAILLVPVSWLVLVLFFKPEMSHLSKTKEDLRQEFHDLPPMGREEKITLVIFLLTVFFWLASPLFENWLDISIPISMPVLFTASFFFLPFVSRMTWKDIEPQISWSGIILIVSGISIGMMLYETGAARWLSVVLLSGIGALGTFLMIITIVFLVSFLKLAFSSNTVTATIIIPIIIELAKSLGLPVLAVTLPAAIVASLAFILVTSSPTNVIPYSAGYFSILDMAKAGVVLTLIATIIVAGVIFTVGTMTGLY